MVHYQTTLHDQQISYTLTRQARKTIGLTINHNGLTLRVPFFCSHQAIQHALSKHAAWIINKLAQLSSLPTLGNGKTIYWLGTSLRVCAESPYSFLTSTHCHLAAVDDSNALHSALVTLFKKLALNYLQKRTAYWAENTQLIPTRILLSSAKTRWGSCSQQGVIRLNWRLMQVPLPCIDYVIIHELAHLREMNHSARFWSIVSQYCPDYLQTRKQLHTLPCRDFLITDDEMPDSVVV